MPAKSVWQQAMNQKTISLRSMRLMAEKVMRAVNVAIGNWVAAEEAARGRLQGALGFGHSAER